MTQSKCCPPGSEPALAATHKPRGTESTIGDLPIYEIGEGKNAVIVVYDIYGFEAGRVRFICDQLAEEGFRVILPDFLRGDGFEKTGIAHGSPEMYKWIGSYCDFEKIKKDLDLVHDHLNSKGVEKVASIGYCYGAWVVFRESEYNRLTCGVGCHPSLQVEGLAPTPGTLMSVAKRAGCDMLLLCSKQESDEVKEGGAAIQAVKDKGFDCEVKTFPNQNHGWVIRGDVSDAETATAVKEAMEMAIAFLKKKMA
eukprot:Clim_evm44s214 gene=Clim_evmTU44s214